MDIKEVKQTLKENGYIYDYFPVCPHCGHEDSDAWELSENEGETECPSCGKAYEYTRDIQVSYTTKFISK